MTREAYHETRGTLDERGHDARTVFPELVLVRGGGAALSEGTPLAQATDVRETAGGCVLVSWRSALVVTEAGT